MKTELRLWIRRGLLALAATAVAALLAWPVRSFFLRGQTDFVQLYAGAQLSGSGRLYDPAANYEWHRRLFGVSLPAVLHTRPPFYSVLLRPLAWLPYRIAWWLFVALNVTAAVWVFLRVFRPRSPTAAMGLLHPAVWLAILWGQDVWIAVALCAAAVLLIEQGHDFEAGAVLSLCAIKAHLFLLVPLALLMQKKWRVLAGGAAGGAALIVLSFIGGGWRWPAEYLRVLSSPVIHRDKGGMPNLEGVAVYFGCAEWAVAVSAAVVVLAVAWISRRRGSVSASLAAALVGSFLTSYHAYPHDAVTLLLGFALIRPDSLRGAQAAAWYLLASPLPLLLVLLGPPFHVALPLAAMLALAAMVWPMAAHVPCREAAAAPCP